MGAFCVTVQPLDSCKYVFNVNVTHLGVVSDLLVRKAWERFGFSVEYTRLFPPPMISLIMNKVVLGNTLYTTPFL